MIEFEELPLSWSLTSLKELVIEISYGYTASATDYPVGPKFLRITDLQKNSVNWETVPFCKCDNTDKYKLKKGDIVVARTGATTGKSFLLDDIPETTVFASYLIRIQTSSLCTPEYLAYFMQSAYYWDQITIISKGTAQPGANASILSTLSVPFPPLNEQRRIVAKIEALRARSQRVKEALEAIPPLLDQFRRSVLAAAFRGDLTADWREKNPDVEPASVLLERIRTERRQCWENHLLSQGKNTKKAKYQDAAPIEAKNISELPDNWYWITLGDIAWSVKDGPHFSPKYSENGIPFISGGNVRPDGIDFTNVKYISPELHKELSQRCVPEIDDILYTKGGTTGIARVNTYNQPFNVWVHVAVIKCVPSIERFYLQHVLNSPYCYEQSQKFTHGVGNQDLGLTRMVKITIPLAPLKEQKLIVHRINQYIDTIKRLEKLIDNVKGQSECINQSILAKAFQGELVPQDPNDEPASVLLERIRTERAKLQAQTKTAKKSTTKTSRQRIKKVQQQDSEPVQLELPVLE